MLRRRLIMSIANAFRRMFSSTRLLLIRKAIINTVPTRLISLFRIITTKTEADLKGYSVGNVDVSTTTNTGVKSSVSTHDSKSVNARRKVKTKTKIDPIAYLIGELFFNRKKIQFNSDASPINAEGIVATFEEHELEFDNDSDLITCESEYVTSIDIAQTESDSECITASTVNTDTDRISHNVNDVNVIRASAAVTGIISEHSDNSRAKIVYWIDPIVENGVLILRQVYSAEQSDKIVEVM